MASFAIAVAVSVAITVATRLLFPPKTLDSAAQGPQLSDLAVSSASYGRSINRGDGTVRMSGNMIWSTGLIETATTETQTAGGKGGGASTSSLTSYSYTASFALAFSEGVAQDILRIWADGKLVYDKTGTSGLAISAGLRFNFYIGDEDQLPDPIIEADKGVGNVPAHRGLCYMVANLWPLANFGNRLPSITAEIAYSGTTTLPFTGLTELPSLNIPGSASGGDSASHMYLDPFSDNLYFLKKSPGGISRQSIGSMSTQVISSAGDTLFSGTARYCMNDKIYTQNGNGASEPFSEIEPVGMQLTGGETAFQYQFDSKIGVLQVGSPEIGLPLENFFIINGGNGQDGFRVEFEDTGGIVIQESHVAETGIGRAGHIVQDFFNKRIFSLQENNTTVDVWEITAPIDIGLSGPAVSTPIINNVGSFTKGGVDLTGTEDVSGWCVLPTEEAIILSNGDSMFKMDMNTGAVLARNLTLGFHSEDQWADTGRFGFGNGFAGGGDGGELFLIDTDDLTVININVLTSSSFADSLESNYFKAAWDPRSDSLIFSREHQSSPDAGIRVVSAQLGRFSGLPTTLDNIVSNICLDAGLQADEFDVTALSGQSVLGYVISRQGPARSAIEPLQKGYLFEGFESDWVLKFALRGGSPVLTIAEDDIGRLTAGSNEEFVKETRTQEVELPEVMEILYADKEKDYQQGLQIDKRVTLPTPSQHARNKVSLDLPIVFQPTTVKQLAQRWLYTTWSERLDLQSSLPWKYLRLDPSDIVTMNFRGEARRLRMAQLEIGTGFDIDFVSTQEDAQSNLSDVDGFGGDGFTGQVIPSGLPTRLHLMDLPLLFAADASLQQFSRAYWSASGYDDSWLGTSLLSSRDDGATFNEVGTVSLESAWGFVVGTLADPESTVTWDESITVDVTVARGVSLFVNSTDTEVLNGANALAVFKADGTVEIIQFVTATVLDISTVRLSRLLRGRRGTEPDSVGHGLSEICVLLELNKVMALQLPLDLINVSLPYKAVTLNTLLEDATTLIKTYTGRDLRPYSVETVRGAAAANIVSISWDRRTRFNGELKDGSDLPPLNEGIESYEIEILRESDGAVITTLSSSVESVEYDTGGDFSGATILAPYDDDANDDSVNAATGTLGAEAAIQSVEVKFGAGAVEFSPSSFTGLSSSFVSYPDIAAYTIGANPFTIEGWFRFKDLTESIQVLASHYDNSPAERAWYIMRNGNILRFAMSDDGVAITTIDGAFTWTTGIWYHIAITRDSDNDVRLFVNGTQVGSTTEVSLVVFDSAAVLHVGKFLSIDDRPFVGFADDFRMEVGAARYVMDFTPPTTSFSVVADFVDATFLTPFDLDEDDVSLNTASGTLGSEAKIQRFEYKFGGGAVEFSPSGFSGVSNSFVSYPDIEAYTLGDSDFTIEGWFRFKDLTQITQMFASHYLNTGDQRGWRLSRQGNTVRAFFSDVGGAGGPAFEMSGAFTWSIDTWYHVSVTRNGNTFRVFVDGALKVTATSTITIHNSTAALHIGKFLSIDDRPLVGFADNFRIEIGTARYTKAFTPPAREFTVGPVPQDLFVKVYQLSNLSEIGRGSSVEEKLDLG